MWIIPHALFRAGARLGARSGSKEMRGCACLDCFANAAKCPCVRLNGQRLPYRPVRATPLLMTGSSNPSFGRSGGGKGSGGLNGFGPVTGVALEDESLGLTRTKVLIKKRKRKRKNQWRRVIDTGPSI